MNCHDIATYAASHKAAHKGLLSISHIQLMSKNGDTWIKAGLSVQRAATFLFYTQLTLDHHARKWLAEDTSLLQR